MLASLLAWSLVAGVGALMVRVLLSRWEVISPDGSREIEETTGHEVVKWGGRIAITAMALGALSFWGGATSIVVGGLGTAGGNTSGGTPSAPVVSGVSATVTDTSTTRVMYTVTPGVGSAHDSSRVTLLRLASADTLIDSIFGGAVTDKTVASNTNLKADTTYRVFVRARATNGAGWSAAAVDTFVNTASAWPNNEPASMVEIASTDGSDKYFGTGGSGTGWFFGTRWTSDTSTKQNISASGSKYGTAILVLPGSGFTSNWIGIAEYNWSSTVGTRRHIYARYVLKYSSNWQVCSTNEKPFGYLGGPGGDGADVYPYMGSSRALTLANELTGAGFNDINMSATLPLGSWFTLEVYYVAESSAGGSDGSYTFWLDGVQTATASSRNWGSGTPGWTQMQAINYWGGSGCTKTVTDTIFVSEIYVSGKN